MHSIVFRDMNVAVRFVPDLYRDIYVASQPTAQGPAE